MRWSPGIALVGSVLLWGGPVYGQEVVIAPARDGILSADGRWAAYVVGDGNVIVRNLQTAVETLESVADDGLGRPGSSGLQPTLDAEDGPGISLDSAGGIVAFTSTSQFDAGDVNASVDVYVRDRAAGITRRASVASDGSAANGASWSPRLSGDGRFVAFTSAASNLVPGDTNGVEDVFVHDRVSGTTTRVSVSSTDAQADRAAIRPAINGDGSIVAFVSLASTLVPSLPFPDCARSFLEDPRPCQQAFVRDRLTGVTSSPLPGRDHLNMFMADVSADGRLVAGGAHWAFIGHTVTNNFLVVDRLSGELVREGADSGSTQGPEVARSIDLSDDGRYLAFGPNVDDRYVWFYAIAREGPLGTRNRGLDERVDTGYGFSVSLSADGLLCLQTGRPTTGVGPMVRLFHRDIDGDAMLDEWERVVGLDPSTPDGAADPDGDGVSNLAEYVRGGHPRGVAVNYLPEGSSGTWFHTQYSLANPHDVEASFAVRLVTTADQGDAGVVQRLAPRSQVLVDFPPLVDGAFAAVVESDRPLVVDRTMTWDAAGFGSSAEAGTVAPSTTWYFAEGATGGGFDVFYLLFNPAAVAATVEITYLRPYPAPPLVTRIVLPAQSRTTIHVDEAHPDLAGTDVAARLVSDQPIVAERSMYLTTGGVAFAAGHAAAGAPAPALRWYLAEGATGPFFDTFVLAMNPGPVDAQLRVTYVLPEGAPLVREYGLSHESRLTIPLDDQDPRLSNTPVSTIVESTNGVPVVVERAMWWPSGNWYEGHATGAATAAATRWAVARVEVGGSAQAETYVLILNTTASPARVHVSVLSRPWARDVDLPPFSRVSVPMSRAFPEIANNGPLGILVESDGAEIVVERAIYTNGGGVVWAAGSVVMGTRLP
jgi:hypothetical protein